MIYTDRVCERAYAKINLHLDITGRLEGGFHAVSTVMQTLSLCDEVTVSDIAEAEKNEFFVSCNVSDVPTDDSNLAVKAAKLFCERVGICLFARIHIEKNIPMAAGMAGGSADGAAVLRGLNRALGEPLTVGELCAIGSKLGADVPFCIVGGTVYADGKGDILHELPKMPECVIVAACEGEGVSTPWAYRLLDGIYGNFTEDSVYVPKSTDGLITALEKGDVKAVAANIYNIFEPPVLSERPVAERVKGMLLDGGAVAAMMSGSGPSVFGIFLCEKCAKGAAELIKKNGFTPYVCRPM